MAGEEPTVIYFGIRGRAEMVKIASALAGQKFKLEEPDRAHVKVGGACIPQTFAILRYIGRAHDLFGSTNLEATMIDAFMDGINDLSMKLRSALIAPAAEKEEAKAAFWAAHVDPASKAQANGGAHFAFLADLVNKYGDGFTIGSKPSIADAALLGRLDLFTTVFGDKWRTVYPAIASIMTRLEEIPSVKAYLASDQRLPSLFYNPNK